MGTGVSGSRVWLRQYGGTNVSRLAVMLHVLVVIGGLLALAVVMPVDAVAALLSTDQADGSAPNGGLLSAETQSLFQAVRDGDLGAVQQAVLDGADILAVNADGVSAADLAESLNHFTITHFLRAYQAIEERTGSPTTVVEAEEPVRAPSPPVQAPTEATMPTTPMSGQGIVPEKEPVTDPVSKTPIAETQTTLVQSPADETVTRETVSAGSSPVAPVSELFGETVTSGQTQVEQQTGLNVPGEPSGDYLARLSVLNPAHELRQSVPPAPTGQIVDTGDSLQDITTVADTPAGGEILGEIPGGDDADTAVAAEMTEPSHMTMAFTPKIPSRKPATDAVADEPAIFASVEPKQPSVESTEPVDSAAEVDVMMLAEVPDPPVSPEPAETADPAESEDGSFFARMRVFDEELTGEPPADVAVIPEPATRARNTDSVPEYEQIRAAVIEKLRRESDARSRQLADVRNENLKEVEKVEMIREHESGSLNIQTELRAKQRTALTGTSLPPGYAPPPDGGSSGIRFLQRMGLFDGTESAQMAEMGEPRETAPPSGFSPYDQPMRMESGVSTLLPVLTPGSLAKKPWHLWTMGIAPLRRDELWIRPMIWRSPRWGRLPACSSRQISVIPVKPVHCPRREHYRHRLTRSRMFRAA